MILPLCYTPSPHRTSGSSPLYTIRTLHRNDPRSVALARERGEPHGPGQVLHRDPALQRGGNPRHSSSNGCRRSWRSSTGRPRSSWSTTAAGTARTRWPSWRPSRDPRFKLIQFSRNFGHQVAITAGMDAASGDAVIIMDADLQDPPYVILQMIEKWKEGYEVVYGLRQHREGERLFKTATASMFYGLLHRIADIDTPVDVGDFRLVDRKALNAFLSDAGEQPLRPGHVLLGRLPPGGGAVHAGGTARWHHALHAAQDGDARLQRHPRLLHRAAAAGPRHRRLPRLRRP